MLEPLISRLDGEPLGMAKQDKQVLIGQVVIDDVDHFRKCVLLGHATHSGTVGKDGGRSCHLAADNDNRLAGLLAQPFENTSPGLTVE